MSKPSLTKSELREVLSAAKNSKERNKAVKLLKKFTTTPNYAHDEEHGKKSNLTFKKYNHVCAYQCYRCDRVFQVNVKVTWHVPGQGNKTICAPCYNQLLEKDEVRALRKHHQKEGLVPKGMGFGMTM